MQGQDRSHHHHSPRLRIALAAGAAGLALAAPAVAAQNVALPSPLSPLSPSPPLGPATSSTERIQHRIRSAVHVRVSILPSGAPFAVSADQTLVVSVPGDYYLLIGAPLLGVTALPGSEATPGLRSTSIVWEGFNPGRRALASRASLVAAQVVPVLPLRIEAHNGSTTFVNRTGVTVASFTADADPAPLLRYIEQLRHASSAGLPLPQGTAALTSPTRAVQARIVVPLRVHGTVGGRLVDARVTGRFTVPAQGRVAVSVEPQPPAAGPLTGVSGREALARAVTLALTEARLRQFERFLDNPDPTGSSTTVYSYRTATPPRPPVAVQPATGGRDWLAPIAVAGALVLAAVAGLAVWARA